MKNKSRMTAEQKSLMRRYLIWCFKTTKEDLDRIDRYFTQLMVDEYVLSQLLNDSGVKDKKAAMSYLEKISEFEQYIEKKEEKVVKLKYNDREKNILTPEYTYLNNRLKAIQKAASYFLGAVELKKIKALYEEEMTKRILEAREHN